ncbi:hypothetical protein DKP78_20780, partial [Enterococcus faecium]
QQRRQQAKSEVFSLHPKPGLREPLKMRVCGSVVVLSFLCVLSESILPPSKEDLSQISLQGEKYLDKQIENAITGVKEMKTVMEKSGD